MLVFTRTKHGADKLVRSLESDGIARGRAARQQEPERAHDARSPTSRPAASKVLVATDIAARGIDIDQLPHVVNYDLPNVPEDYIHRIGRTGRAGSSGEAISLVCVDERVFLRDIERLIKRQIPQEVIAGFEPDPNARRATGVRAAGPPAGSGRSTRLQPGPGARTRTVACTRWPARGRRRQLVRWTLCVPRRQSVAGSGTTQDQALSGST